MILLETNKWIEVVSSNILGKEPIIRGNVPYPMSVLWWRDYREMRFLVNSWAEDTKLASIYDVHILGVYK